MNYDSSVAIINGVKAQAFIKMTQAQLNYVSCPGISAMPPSWASAERRSQTEQVPEGMHRMAYWQWNATGDPAHPRVIVCAHGLSRQGRDFDVLARELSQHARVICPDVVGRGESDWLADSAGYQVPMYAADMLAMLAQVNAQAPIQTLDWVGTSMGGLIGMVLAGQPGLPLPQPISRLVLNDVGPTIQWAALQRIGQYLGKNLQFANLEQAAASMRLISEGFGPHTDEEWMQLSIAMVKPHPQSGVVLHYDPRIAEPMASMTQEAAQAGEAMLWQLYDQIKAQVLLLRGAQSDLISPQTAERMHTSGPRAQCVELEGIGHAPTLMAHAQVQLVSDFLAGKANLPTYLALE